MRRGMDKLKLHHENQIHLHGPPCQPRAKTHRTRRRLGTAGATRHVRRSAAAPRPAGRRLPVVEDACRAQPATADAGTDAADARANAARGCAAGTRRDHRRGDCAGIREGCAYRAVRAAQRAGESDMSSQKKARLCRAFPWEAFRC